MIVKHLEVSHVIDTVVMLSYSISCFGGGSFLFLAESHGLLSGVLTEIEIFFCGPFTPCWMVHEVGIYSILLPL